MILKLQELFMTKETLKIWIKRLDINDVKTLNCLKIKLAQNTHLSKPFQKFWKKKAKNYSYFFGNKIPKFNVISFLKFLWIPRSVRILVAQKLSSIIKACVSSHSVEFWEELLLFFYCVLHIHLDSHPKKKVFTVKMKDNANFQTTKF